MAQTKEDGIFIHRTTHKGEADHCVGREQDGEEGYCYFAEQTWIVRKVDCRPDHPCPNNKIPIFCILTAGISYKKTHVSSVIGMDNLLLIIEHHPVH